MPPHDFIVQDNESQFRLDVYLTKHLAEAPSRAVVQKVITAGKVKVNSQIKRPNYKLLTNDHVVVDITKDEFLFSGPKPQDMKLDIFYEDESLFIINKPAGLLVHPTTTQSTDTLVNALLFKAKNLSDFNSSFRPGIVHRLDQDTSGLMIVAKDNITHAKLAKQFQRKEVKKRYVALVEGIVEFDEGRINEPIGTHPTKKDKKAVRHDDDQAREAITFYKVLKRGKESTLVALYPKTGRTHQLRVHMKHLGHPILGDEKYGKKNNFSRLALHAQSVGFTHPVTKAYVEFLSPMPKIFLEHIK